MARAATRGFTLIEILAVVAILALVAAFVVPNMGGFRARALRAEAQQLAAQLELARQRAIVTGVPHRALARARPGGVPARVARRGSRGRRARRRASAELDLNGNTPLSLSAPPARELEYRPIPGNFGNLQVVAEPFYFEAVETPQGRITRGEVVGGVRARRHRRLHRDLPPGRAGRSRRARRLPARRARADPP